MLGGHGVSRSGDGSIAITLANNEGWHDDVSDGFMKRISGRTFWSRGLTRSSA